MRDSSPSASTRYAAWQSELDRSPSVSAQQLVAVCDSLVSWAGGVAAPDVAAGVLACVATLRQLGSSLAEERARQLILASELSDARASLAQSRRQALHDELTELPNRRFFDEWLDHMLVRETPHREPLAVLYLDLDGFKAINDTYGHAVGDELLRIVAIRLAGAVRAEDVISRLGGDEFACLLANLPGRDQLGRLACKLIDAVSAPIRLAAHELTVRPSIGIAMCPADGACAATLMRCADAAMYHAKRQGCGHAFYDQTGVVL